MINRRAFLKNLALGVAGLYVPKTLIFDMGANSYKQPLGWIDDGNVFKREDDCLDMKYEAVYLPRTKEEWNRVTKKFMDLYGTLGEHLYTPLDDSIWRPKIKYPKSMLVDAAEGK